jgi:hypothetical protein
LYRAASGERAVPDSVDCVRAGPIGPAELAAVVVTGADAAGSPLPGGSADATWLNAGAAEVQPCGIESAPSDAALPVAADTALPGEAHAPPPISSEDLNIGKPPPNAPVIDPKDFVSDDDDPSIETAEVSIDAPDVAPDARLVPADVAVLEDDVEVAAVSDVSGAVDVEDVVAVDAAACAAPGAAAELRGDMTCEAVPTGAPAAWVTAAAIPEAADALVVCGGSVNGAIADAADDAPA